MTMSNETNNTTRPMTAKEYYDAIEVFEFERPDIVIKPKYIFEFARVYANYRLRFEQEQKARPIDPFEGAPEWAEWRAADRDGGEHWYAQEPQQDDFLGIHDANGFYMRCPDRRLKYTDWRQSPAKRQR